MRTAIAQDMVKKTSNPLDIDYHKCTIESKLLQIRNLKDVNVPDVENVWTIDIEPKFSKMTLEFIRKNTQNIDPISLLHIKRIKKIVKDDGHVNLTVVICSMRLFQTKEELLSIIDNFNNDFKYSNLTNENKVPIQSPSRKEQMVEWSEKYWPLVWRGNPNDQILNDYTFDMLFIEDILSKISNISKEQDIAGSTIPVVTAFVDPRNSSKVIYSVDTRHKPGCLPYDHSIMNGIIEVGKTLTNVRNGESNMNKNEDGYLCLDFDIYTTHEPCSMCSMALIHSRIKRCIFLKPMARTGSFKLDSGDGYCMHSNKLLNSKYEVFQWIGQNFDLPNMDDDICC